MLMPERSDWCNFVQILTQMLRKIFHENTYILLQDTIQSPSNNQDSSVVGTLEIQIPDTSEEFSSGLNDTLAAQKN